MTTVRQLSAQDVDAVLDIELADTSADDAMSVADKREYVATALATVESIHLGAFLGNELAGFCSLKPERVAGVWAVGYAVRPERRRLGIGRLLLDEAAALAVSIPDCRLLIARIEPTNRPSIALASSAGFVPLNGGEGMSARVVMGLFVRALTLDSSASQSAKDSMRTS